MTRRTALVTGATGVIGPTLVRRLLGAGYRVRSLSRGDGATLPIEVEHTQGSTDDRSAVERAVAGAEVVFHLAAKLHINGAGPSIRTAYEQSNVEGTRMIARAARGRRFVQFSTIAVYGYGRQVGMIDETVVPQPDTIYGQTKLAAESLALDTGNAVVLRLAAVYGPELKGNYRTLVRALRGRYFIPIGPGENRRTLVHVEDVASAALCAAGQQAATGRVYNVTDGAVHTVHEIVAAICHAMRRRPPRLYVPIRTARASAGALEALAALIRKPAPITRAMVDKYVEDVAVDGSRIQQELDFRPAYDLVAGWRTALSGTP